MTQIPVGGAAERAGPRCDGMLRADYGEGGRVVVVGPDRFVKVLTEGFQSACEADVSWDGRKILFAGKRTAADRWNVFEVGVDGRGLRQVTRDLGDCRSPRYLSSLYTITEDEPWDQIAFVVTLDGRRNEHGGAPPTAIQTCKLDGTDVQRLSYNLSNDFDPLLTGDGRLVHAAWHLATFDYGVRGRIGLNGMNVDGTDRAPFAERSGRRVQHMPCVTPDGRVVFVETDNAPWDGSGTLAHVLERRPLHSYQALSRPDDGYFHSPAPLTGGTLMVAWRPADGSGTLGLYLWDPATRKKTLILDDSRYHEMHARSVVARPRADGRSSVVTGDDPRAGLYCLGVGTSDLPASSWLPAGTAKSVRVIEGLGDRRADAGPPAGGPPELSRRRVLAEVPLKSDGSFHLKVPANTPVMLQVLDERGLALRSCGWVWARSHQEQGCIGCHEDPERTPDNRVPEALFGAPVEVAMKPATTAPIDFRRDVSPILDAKCLGCHGPGGGEPRLGERPVASNPEAARAAFEALMAATAGEGADSGLGKYVHPGRARTSPLVWHVLGRNTARPWDGDARKGTVRPIPSGGPPALTDEELKSLIRWIDLGAAWDGRPAGPGAGGPH